MTYHYGIPAPPEDAPHRVLNKRVLDTLLLDRALRREYASPTESANEKLHMERAQSLFDMLQVLVWDRISRQHRTRRCSRLRSEQLSVGTCRPQFSRAKSGHHSRVCISIFSALYSATLASAGGPVAAALPRALHLSLLSLLSLGSMVQRPDSPLLSPGLPMRQDEGLCNLLSDRVIVLAILYAATICVHFQQAPWGLSVCSFSFAVSEVPGGFSDQKSSRRRVERVFGARGVRSLENHHVAQSQ